VVQDFEGRAAASGDEAGTLTITGAPERVILRWRFAGPRTVTVNGRAVAALRTSDGIFAEFDHRDKTALRWQ
jgi:hypothetical protein